MINVAGLDISVSSTGLALPSGNLHTIASGMSPDQTGKRLAAIERRFLEAMQLEPIDVVIIEGYGWSSKRIVRTAEVGGVMRKCLYDLGIAFMDQIPPASLKLFATGNGRAEKADMVKIAKLAGGKPKNADEADAFWLKVVGDCHYNMGQFDQLTHLNEPQENLINRLKWPTIRGLKNGDIQKP